MARESLITSFEFSEKQAQAIIELQLQRLTGMEQQKILEELAEAACLCRVGEHPEERAAIRTALLVAPSPERAIPTEQRRRFTEAVLSGASAGVRIVRRCLCGQPDGR